MAVSPKKMVGGKPVSLTKEEREQRLIDEAAHQVDFVKHLLMLTKDEAARRIAAVAPLYKQINLFRENPAHPVFEEIDRIRVQSNCIEQMIQEKTYDDLVNFDVKGAWEDA